MNAKDYLLTLRRPIYTVSGGAMGQVGYFDSQLSKVRGTPNPLGVASGLEPENGTGRRCSFSASVRPSTKAIVSGSEGAAEKNVDILVIYILSDGDNNRRVNTAVWTGTTESRDAEDTVGAEREQGGGDNGFASKSQAGGVCLLFVFRCMRPEGPWQRLAATLTDNSAFLTSSIRPDPIPNHYRSYWGNPSSFSPIPPRQAGGQCPVFIRSDGILC